MPAVNCHACQGSMQDMGSHGTCMGGLTVGVGAALVGRKMADDAEEAVEKNGGAGLRLSAMS
ncbi:MAG: hypothetical protein AB7T01_13065 [Acidithiobacillus sp.]